MECTISVEVDSSEEYLKVNKAKKLDHYLTYHKMVKLIRLLLVTLVFDRMTHHQNFLQNINLIITEGNNIFRFEVDIENVKLTF